MTGPPVATQRYLDRNGIKGPWQLAGEARSDFRGAVVVPSLAEGDRLFATLRSLSDNPPEWINRFLVVVVCNHGQRADRQIRLQNEIDLARLSDYARGSDLCLAWVDAVSPGLEVPAHRAGVGFARKLGMDLALPSLDWSGDPLLVGLDADTLVEDNYLQTIDRHFLLSSKGAAVLPYRHQPGVDPDQQAAIDRYELFLRSYVYGLRLAGSPYAFNTVGSAMACRAAAYVRCGGMNSRRAGEDFYFLQKLAKTDGVGLLSGTLVYPEPRVSERVPFGTGRSMARLLAGDKQGVRFYPVAAFRTLSDWLKLVEYNISADAEQILSLATEISPVLAGYINQLDWRSVWPGMQKTHQRHPRLQQAFHVWFDGFRTLRLIHLLCDSEFGRGEPEEILPEYFTWQGCAAPASLGGMLEALRVADMA